MNKLINKNRKPNTVTAMSWLEIKILKTIKKQTLRPQIKLNQQDERKTNYGSILIAPWNKYSCRTIALTEITRKMPPAQRRQNVVTNYDSLKMAISRSCQPLRYSRHWIYRKPLETEPWFQRTTNRKMAYGVSMVTWPMTSRDPERSNSWAQYD